MFILLLIYGMLMNTFSIHCILQISITHLNIHDLIIEFHVRFCAKAYLLSEKICKYHLSLSHVFSIQKPQRDNSKSVFEKDEINFR